MILEIVFNLLVYLPLVELYMCPGTKLSLQLLKLKHTNTHTHSLILHEHVKPMKFSTCHLTCTGESVPRPADPTNTATSIAVGIGIACFSSTRTWMTWTQIITIGPSDTHKLHLDGHLH